VLAEQAAEVEQWWPVSFVRPFDWTVRWHPIYGADDAGTSPGS